LDRLSGLSWRNSRPESGGQVKYDVGGIELDRPFKTTRLGHFGFDNVRFDESLRFYTEELGFRISDALDHKLLTQKPELLSGLGDTNGYFLRHGTEHHAFALFNRRVRAALSRTESNPEITANQITFQVGTLREVVEAHHWFIEKGLKIQRAGRDRRGANWHTYFYDPDGHPLELFYGMEQIGWNGHSKPADQISRRINQVAELPQISEVGEIQEAIARGVDIMSGYRGKDSTEPHYDVGGILLPRPFKIARVGPVRLFVANVGISEAFYRDILGLTVTEEVTWQGHRCVFMRANTEHHSLALYPVALRAVLGINPRSTCLSFGLQLASYRQLRDAVPHLAGRGHQFVEIPPDLRPGVDYAAYVLDPDGHALELYYYMEQIGWDGVSRPPAQRRQVTPGSWPQTLEPMSDTFAGEPFLGPLG
jgi:catechol 2,3-dioxygenase-like lactoylglutathione lyase family enzyme